MHKIFRDGCEYEAVCFWQLDTDQDSPYERDYKYIRVYRFLWADKRGRDDFHHYRAFVDVYGRGSTLSKISDRDWRLFWEPRCLAQEDRDARAKEEAEARQRLKSIVYDPLCMVGMGTRLWCRDTAAVYMIVLGMYRQQLARRLV